MSQPTLWANDDQSAATYVLFSEILTAAYNGRFRTAREMHQRLTDLARRDNPSETMGNENSQFALAEALVGNMPESQQLAEKVLKSTSDRGARSIALLSFAIAGNTARAEAILAELATQFPEDTELQFVKLPQARAQLALGHRDPVKAIEILRAATAYEFGWTAHLVPVNLRGLAYFAAHEGTEAAAEFQKILTSRAIVQNAVIGALAHLQLGRAYAMQGDTTKAKAAYQDFLTLWKDADPDIPILIAAKAEYAKLQ